MAPETSDRRQLWNERYSQSELVWSAGPNQFLEREAAGLPPGRALDLGTGEGRNAIWLAQQGWTVTAVDFSDIGIAKGRARAESLDLSIGWEVADLLEYQPQARAFDLVISLYIHLPASERAIVFATAANAVAPGGTLLVIGHDSGNVAHGVGGPQDPSVLYSASDVIADIGDELQPIRAGQVLRAVATDDGARNAIDVLVRAERPAAEAPDPTKTVAGPTRQPAQDESAGHPER